MKTAAPIPAPARATMPKGTRTAAQLNWAGSWSSGAATGWRGVPSKIATYRVRFRAIRLTVPV